MRNISKPAPGQCSTRIPPLTSLCVVIVTVPVVVVPSFAVVVFTGAVVAAALVVVAPSFVVVIVTTLVTEGAVEVDMKTVVEVTGASDDVVDAPVVVAVVVGAGVAVVLVVEAVVVTVTVCGFKSQSPRYGRTFSLTVLKSATHEGCETWGTALIISLPPWSKVVKPKLSVVYSVVSFIEMRSVVLPSFKKPKIPEFHGCTPPSQVELVCPKSPTIKTAFARRRKFVFLC